MRVHKLNNAKPTVYVAAGQHECLNRLAERSPTDGADLLRRELERAIVVSDDEAPRNFVQLNSIVEYEDLLSGRARTITLVAPTEADIDQNKVSVITPVGAAVLGLVPGASCSWLSDDGHPRALVIRRVENRS
jgi:regulator of nucleoside diphosphate kinase